MQYCKYYVSATKRTFGNIHCKLAIPIVTRSTQSVKLNSATLFMHKHSFWMTVGQIDVVVCRIIAVEVYTAKWVFFPLAIPLFTYSAPRRRMNWKDVPSSRNLAKLAESVSISADAKY